MKTHQSNNNPSGLNWILNSLLEVVLLFGATLISCQQPELSESDSSKQTKDSTIVLQVAGYDFDRLKGIISGAIPIEGCEVQFHKVGIGDANSAAFSGAGTYDITEIGMHPFMLAFANDDFRDYTLIPVFPLRTFRHKSIFIRNDRGIENPRDLIGKRVGTPGYSSTSLTWIRGMLQDEYGVSPKDIQWVFSTDDSSVEAAGNASAQEQVVPSGITVLNGTPGKDESDLLVSGEIDAVFHAVEPKAFVQGNPLVERLFVNARQVERDYYQKTRIFPIMHVVAIKSSLVEQHPWLPKAVFEAYSKAKTQYHMHLRRLGWAYSSLPWFAQEFEETRKLMGDNFWPYGIEQNRKTLETLFRYSYEQGLSSKLLTIEELFHDSTLESERDELIGKFMA